MLTCLFPYMCCKTSCALFQLLIEVPFDLISQAACTTFHSEPNRSMSRYVPRRASGACYPDS